MIEELKQTRQLSGWEEYMLGLEIEQEKQRKASVLEQDVESEVSREFVTPAERGFEGDLTPQEEQELKSRGYEVLHKLGEGQTREAYLARFNSGEVSKLRVVKIPKTEISPDSICTIINKSKRDVDLVEVHISNEIQHPNIVEVVDNFRLNDKTVNVEAYYEGTDLESRIKNMGPIQDETRFNDIFSQVISAMDYLNNEKNILHRDIKPSNILVTRQGVKLSDLQNAARVRDIHEVSMPTRGGTPYTHPKLLNALILNEPASASKRTEVYALGGTMLYALTGKNPFGYGISSDPNGKPIQIDGKTYHIKLDSEGVNLEEITEKIHETKLKQALKNVPKKYKNLITRCLTLDDKKSFNDMYDVRREFGKVSSGFGRKFKEGLAKGVKIAIPLAVMGAIGYGTIIGGIHASKREPKPTFSQVLSNRHYRDFSLEDLDRDDYSRAIEIVRPYMKMAEKELQEVEEGLENKKGLMGVEDFANFANTVHGIPKRITASWLRACYLNPDFGKRYSQEGQQRFKGSYVPKNFMVRNSRETRRGYYDERTGIAHGIMYLKQCFTPEGDVTDLFTNYFSSLENKNTARVSSKSIDYFPKVRTFQTDKTASIVGTIEKGYHMGLPSHEQELVNTAIALYMITDEDGKTDFNKIPDKPMFPTGFISN